MNSLGLRGVTEPELSLKSMPRVAHSRIPRKRFPIPFARWMQLLPGLVFLFAAVAKSLDPVRFGRQIEAILFTVGLDRTPLMAAVCFAVGLLIILLEYQLGASLISGYKSVVSSRFAVIVLFLFSGLAVWIILKGDNLNCGCFGAFGSRSAREALSGDLILLLMSIIGTSHKIPARRGRILTRTIVIAGFSLVGLFYFVPTTDSALREGASFKGRGIISGGVISDLYYAWIFNVDCNVCQRLTPLMSLISASAPDKFIGMTAQSPGKIDEFKFDFNPKFKIVGISEDTYSDMGLEDGTLLGIKSGRIVRIWSPYTLWEVKAMGAFE